MKGGINEDAGLRGDSFSPSACNTVRVRCLVLLIAACGSSSPQPVANRGSDSAPVTAPNRDELIALLQPHATHPLAAANERGCPADETLGVWTARLIQYGSPNNDGDVHRLTGGCGARTATMNLPPPTSEDAATYWYCSIDAYSSDPAGESPWSCGLIVRVRKADRSVDLTTLSCPGTC